jgi:hypothetical protein
MKEDLGRLWGWGGNEVVAAEDAADGADRRDLLQLGGQVVGDGVRAGVEAGGGQVGSQLEDQGLGLSGHLVGAGPRSSGAGFQCLEAAGVITAEEFVDPAARDAMAAGQFGGASALGFDRLHHVPSQAHRSHLEVSTMS